MARVIAEAEKIDKGNPPTVRVKSAGRVSSRLETIALIYEQAHPDRRVRWVYSPQHKPELSNVMDRAADGYQLVTVQDLGDNILPLLPGVKADETVRVADVVLMSIERTLKEEASVELERRAAEELRRVDSEYYAAIEEAEARAKDGTVHKASARGTSYIEAVEHEVDVHESLKEK